MSNATWKCRINGQKYGPFDTTQLRQLVETGKLRPTDFIWREGLEDWVPASEVKGLFPATEAPHAQEPADRTRQADGHTAQSEEKSGALRASRGFDIKKVGLALAVVVIISIIGILVWGSGGGRGGMVPDRVEEPQRKEPQRKETRGQRVEPIAKTVTEPVTEIGRLKETKEKVAGEMQGLRLVAGTDLREGWEEVLRETEAKALAAIKSRLPDFHPELRGLLGKNRRTDLVRDIFREQGNALRGRLAAEKRACHTSFYTLRGQLKAAQSAETVSAVHAKIKELRQQIIGNRRAWLRDFKQVTEGATELVDLAAELLQSEEALLLEFKTAKKRFDDAFAAASAVAQSDPALRFALKRAAPSFCPTVVRHLRKESNVADDNRRALMQSGQKRIKQKLGKHSLEELRNALVEQRAVWKELVELTNRTMEVTNRVHHALQASVQQLEKERLAKVTDEVDVYVRDLKDREPKRRSRAAMNLARLRAPSSLPALLDALRREPHAYTRAWLYSAITYTQGAKAIPLLEKGLGDPDKDVRSTAVGLLGQLGPEGIPALLKATRSKQASVRRDSLHELLKSSDKRATPAMITALADKSADVRKQALTGLAKLLDSRAIAPTADDLSDHEYLRVQLLLQHARAGHTKPLQEYASARLFKLLKARIYELRKKHDTAKEHEVYAIAETLARISYKPAFQQIVAVLSLPNPHWNTGLRIRAMSFYGDPAVIPACLRAAAIDVRHTRGISVAPGSPISSGQMQEILADNVLNSLGAAILEIGRSAIKPLVAGTYNEDPVVRACCLKIIGDVRAVSARDEVSRCLKDKNSGVRHVALGAAKQLESGSQLLEALTKFKPGMSTREVRMMVAPRGETYDLLSRDVKGRIGYTRNGDDLIRCRGVGFASYIATYQNGKLVKWEKRY